MEDDEDLSVRIAGRRLACENSRFTVYFDHVVDSCGNEVADYLVVAPKNPGVNLVTGVVILPVLDGLVGLLRIDRPAIRSCSWELPQGFVDQGETDTAAALRELVEETGLAVEEDHCFSLGFITPDSGVLAARIHLFLVDAAHLVQDKERELGHRVFQFVPVPEFERMIRQSEIQDASTLAAWCRYLLIRSSGDVSVSLHREGLHG